MNKNLICIVGPTAIGKTSLAISLAMHFKTEIISADSRQFYKEMQIGTAAPTKAELSAAPHHFIHHKSIKEKYSVGDFEREALEKLEGLFSKADSVIMVGGSGLYVKAITEGLDEFPEVDPGIRKDLNLRLKNEGLIPLQEQLREFDPIYHSIVDLENPHRLIRALEICIGTGKPYSSFRSNKKTPRPFSVTFVGLTAERETVYRRINSRVEEMVSAGLLSEAENLLPFKDLNPLKTVGYQELFAYLEGKSTLEEATEEIKKNTRRFSKRQMTWFRKNPEIKWFEYKTPPAEIIEFLEKEKRINPS